jgi:hypothetical protein
MLLQCGVNVPLVVDDVGVLLLLLLLLLCRR